MKTIQITVGDTSTTKQSEVDTLRKLQHQFENSGTYLASLFTKDLVDWAESKIKDDFCPDIYTTLCNVRDQLNQADARYTDMEVAANRAIEDATRYKNEAEAAWAGLAECQKQSAEELNSVKAKAHKDLIDEIASGNEVRRVLDQKLDAVREMDATILRLKAHIFNLEHPDMSYPQALS